MKPIKKKEAEETTEIQHKKPLNCKKLNLTVCKRKDCFWHKPTGFRCVLCNEDFMVCRKSGFKANYE